MRRLTDKITATVLVLAMLVSLLTMLELKPAQADDTEETDFTPIYTAMDLYNIRYDLSGNYKLMNDIDLTEATSEGGDLNFMGNGWEPIGSDGIYTNTAFTGIFDGNNYSIKGLNINYQTSPSGVSSTLFLGLFANNSGTIENLRLESINISNEKYGCTYYCGGIAGCSSGTVQNCSVEGKITGAKEGSSVFVGGLIGRGAVDGELIVDSCYNMAEISVTSYSNVFVGGIMGCAYGNNYNAQITRCYNVASLYGKSSTTSYTSNGVYARVSGIIGYGDGDWTQVENCYNTGTVQAIAYSEHSSDFAYAFGIGWIYNSSKPCVNSCYNIGTITTMDGGYSSDGYSISSKCNNCYYLESKGTSNTGATCLTEALAEQQTSYAGFDFENTWIIDSATDYKYPQLRNNRQTTDKAVDTLTLLKVPTKTTYFIDETALDLTGGKFKAYYIDDTSEVIALTEDMVSGYDFTKTGTQTVTITFRSQTLSFDITVIDRGAVTNVAIATLPDKTEFVRGTTFDFTGCLAYITYEDSQYNEYVDVTADMTTGGDITKTGTYTITYEKGGKSDTFTVKVTPVETCGIRIDTLPTKLEYDRNEEIDTTGMVVSVLRNNGTSAVFTDYTIEADTSTAGTKTVTVRYADEDEGYDFSDTFEITVVAHMTSIEIVPANVSLNRGATTTLDVNVIPSDSTDTYTFVSSNPKVVTVNQNGEITGIGAGTTTVTARSSNGLIAKCTVTVQVAATDISVSNKVTSALIGDSISLNVSLNPSDTTDSYTIYSSNTNVVKVNDDDSLSCLAAGKATIVVESTSGATDSWTLEVSNALQESFVTVDTAAKTYSGTEITPDVSAAVNGKSLVKGTDYTVSYTDNKNCGTATIVVTGIGKYSGTLTYHFTINQASLSNCTVTYDSANEEYDGTEKKKDVTVKYNGQTLTEGTDYTLEYPDDITNPGVKTFKVIGMGNFTGEKSYSYTINQPKKITAIFLDKDTLDLATNSMETLTATVFPTNAAESITWSSSDETVAQVDENGTVLAVRYGTATITAANPDGTVVASCEVQTRFWDVAGTDVKGEENYQYYYAPVYWAANKGITTGYDKVYFGVGEDCTRASVMIFLWRIAGSPTPSKDARTYFTDLSKYAKTTATNKAIAWAYEQGISKGYSDGTFGVNASITRKDVLIMLYRYAGKPAVSGTMKFSDCKSYQSTTDTYKAILWGSQKGITGGYSDGTFKPTANCLREQIITFLYRYNNLSK